MSELSVAPAEVRAADRTDPELVAAVRAGSDRAFEELYERYARRVSAYVRGMVGDRARAEDVTQEVFLSAVRRIRATDAPIAFRAWIYEIARNACIDLHRRRGRAEELSIEGEGLGAADRQRLVSPHAGPDEAAEAKQDLHDLAGALGGLSETHHRLLVMRELDGLSYREIGERLDMSRPAVESSLFRARRRLAAEYDDLRSGRRCLQIQALLDQGVESSLGARDRRRFERHLAHCQPCRREARLAGTEIAPRRSLAARLGALLPLPAVLRPRRSPDLAAGVAGGDRASWADPARLGALLDSLGGGWSKAAAVLAVAVASAGAGAVVEHRVAAPPRHDGAGASQPATAQAAQVTRAPRSGASRPAARTHARSPAAHRRGSGTSPRAGAAASTARKPSRSRGEATPPAPTAGISVPATRSVTRAASAPAVPPADLSRPLELPSGQLAPSPVARGLPALAPLVAPAALLPGAGAALGAADTTLRPLRRAGAGG